MGLRKEKKQPLVRIDSVDKAVLEELAAKTGESTPRLLHRAVKSLKKELFFQQMNAAYTDIRNNSDAWDIEQKERALLDKAVADGMDC